MSFAPWLEPLLDAELMRATDAWAIEEQGVPSLELMERAGEGLAAVVAETAPEGRIAIVCGKGNNAGDGFVAARLLREAGREADVLLLWPAQAIEGDARANLDRLAWPPPVDYDSARLEGAAVIVDAMLGTGSDGAPRERVAAAVADLNAAEAPVVAADIPSGVDASTGAVEGEAVRAAATVSFHRGKPGLWIHPGKEHAGRVHVIDIGIPEGAPGVAQAALIGPKVLREIPRRDATWTKFDSGAVCVIGGSRGLTGAPLMAALGAMRAGAGYVTLGVPAVVERTVAAAAPVESMRVGLPDSEGALAAGALGPALEAAARSTAVVLGPGLGRSEESQDLACRLYERVEVPLVVDADGLNALAAGFGGGRFPRRPAPTVLTPHGGELARLLETNSDAVRARRLELARSLAAATRAVVVLKGDDTLVVTRSGRAAVSTGRAPGLATAGTGDVLAGVIGALLARGMPAATAASAAVWLHTRAGQIAAERIGADSVIATDVVAALPAALHE